MDSIWSLDNTFVNRSGGWMIISYAEKATSMRKCEWLKYIWKKRMSPENTLRNSTSYSFDVRGCTLIKISDCFTKLCPVIQVQHNQPHTWQIISYISQLQHIISWPSISKAFPGSRMSGQMCFLWSRCTY